MKKIWLASYPRSGNTLVRAILWHCHGIGSGAIYDEESTSDSDAAIMGFFGGTPDAPQPINIVKTHDLPADDRPAIYIVRDGRAAVVSYWHYLQHYAPRTGLRRILRPRTLDRVIRGKVQFGSWSNHLRAWHPSDRPDTLLLRFEEVAADPNAAAKKIGDFLGLSAPRPFLPTFREMNAAEPAFFRSGDDGRNIAEMSASSRRLFNRLHGTMMARYGYGSAG